MRKLICTTYLLFGFFFSRAQTVEYTHDAHGNRTMRKISVAINPDLARVLKPQNKDSVKIKEEAIMKLAMQYGVSVFPNPTESDIIVSAYQVEKNKAYLITVSDQLGKVIYQQKYFQEKSTIPLANQKPGIYNVSILIDNKDELRYKIVKQ